MRTKNSIYLARILITGENTVIASITNLLDKMGVKINAFEINPTNSNEYMLTISLKSNDELNKVINKIRQINKVQSVERV